jgi:hypothetical protein
MSAAFINLPIGSDGRDEVSINIAEIASFRGHVVTSYSYVDYTEVVMKNGIKYDCRISKSEFEKRLHQAAAMTEPTS